MELLYYRKVKSGVSDTTAHAQKCDVRTHTRV